MNTRFEQAAQVAEKITRVYGCRARPEKYAELTVIEIENVDQERVPPAVVGGFLVWRKAP